MQITMDELKAIPSPTPTKTWNPIPHHEIATTVENQLAKFGIGIADSKIDADPTGNNVFVTHSLDFGTKYTEGIPQFGWRNSINKKLSLGFTSGTCIIVCSNLVFNGSWLEFKKHTSTLEEDTIIDMTLKGIKHVAKESQVNESWYEELKLYECDNYYADHMFMQMLRTGVVSSRQVLDLSNAFDEERKRYGDNLYTIYNSATQTFRELTLPTISQKSLLLNRMIKKEQETFEVEAIAA